MAWSRIGFGLFSTTTSWLSGIATTTKTPDAKNQTMVGAKNQHPQFKGKKAAAPRWDTPGSETRRAKLLSASPKKMTHALNSDRIGRHPKYFGGLSAPHHDMLAGALQTMKDAFPPDPNLPKELQGAEMMVLTQALATVTKDLSDRNGVEDAIRGLHCLRNIDLRKAIRSPYYATPENLRVKVDCPDIGCGWELNNPHDETWYDQEDFDAAWRLAQALASTPVGFDLLKKMTVTGKSPSATPPHPTIIRHDDAMLHVYLDATREMANEAKKAGDRTFRADPNSVYYQLHQNLVAQGAPADALARCKDNGSLGTAPDGTAITATLLEKGLIAARDYLRQSHQAARDEHRQNEEFKPQKNGYAWAASAIRNGLYTEHNLDNGKPSLFRLIEGRTIKLGQAAVASVNREQTRRGRAVAFLKKQFMPQKDKNPFDAYNDLGDGRSAIGFKQGAGWGAIQEGRIVKQVLIGNLTKALRAEGGTGSDGERAPLKLPLAPLPTAGRTWQLDDWELRNMVRLALLQEKQATTTLLPRYVDGDPLNSFALERARLQVYRWCGGRNKLDDDSRKRIEWLLNKDNQDFLPPTLMTWAGELGGPGIPSDLADLIADGPPNRYSNDDPDWYAFALGIERTVNSVVREPYYLGTPNLKTARVPADEKEKVGLLADRFQAAIENQELGSRISYSSGGVYGANTSGVSRTISAVAMGGSASGKVKLAYDRGRAHVFEAGTGTAGNELVLATETSHAARVGAGWTVGFGTSNLQVGPNAGGELNGGQDRIDRRGAVFRFRRLYTGVLGDEGNNAKLGRLAKMVIDPDSTGAYDKDGNLVPWTDPGDPHDCDSILKRILHEFDDVSVSWMGVDDSTTRAGASANAGVGIKFMPFNLNLVGGVLSHDSRKNRQRWREQGGSLRVDKNVKTLGLAHRTTATLASPGIGIAPGGGVSGPGLDLATVSMDFYKKSCIQRDTLIDEDGEFKKQTFRTRTFANIDELYDFIKDKLDTMAVDKARKFEAARYHGDVNPGENPRITTMATRAADLAEREATVQNEYLKLLQFLEQAKQDARPNQTFQVYYEVKQEVVVAVNAIKSLMAGARAHGDEKGVKDCEERIRKLLADENAWEYAFFISLDETSVSRRRGVNFVVKDQKTRAATFTRIRTFT
jgi:hypothetical protein